VRILYGVVGEGMGHATRSRGILEHLVKRHEVQIVVSGRAHDYLKRHFEGVKNIWGFQIAYADNEVKNVKTLFANLKGALKGLPKNFLRYIEVARSFQPEAVISDFESWSYLFGKNYLLPVFCLDNIQIVHRCAHSKAIIKGYEKDFRLANAIVKSKLPGCAHYLITTFFYPRVAKARTTLHPPVLRREILDARSEPGDHLLVYQTSTSNKTLVDSLRKSGVPCRVYGMKRELARDEVDGNLTYRPFSEAGFIDDLRTARGVVANGGFTLLSEAVYLHKPVLAVPVGKQFEQILNARYVESLHYGAAAEEVTGDTLGAFLERVPEYTRALSTYRQNGNAQILAALDGLLDAVAERSGSRSPASGA
jgi:uncharacterized protein (TIGR00661 family)